MTDNAPALPWAVVLAGGVGSRFWPLSTPEKPKQLLPLVSEDPMLADTLRRLEPLVPRARILILTSGQLADAIAEVSGLPKDQILIEPKAAGTAAALAWAASEIVRRTGDPQTPMVSVHSDWVVGNDDAFRAVLARAVVVASESRGIVTVGIVPTRPDVGFGYIIPGDNDPSGARVVHRFVEKPDRDRATELIAAGALWNSGIFVWQSGVFLEQIRKHTPEVSSALGSSNGDASAFFNGVTPISVDHGVLERTDRVLVLDGDFGWDDVGTWTALHRVRELDTNRNALRGTVHAKDAHGNVVHAGDSAIVLYGVDDLVVVEREGLVLVTTRERSAELKNLVESLPEKLRDRG